MKGINIFSTAISASARSWHQPIIIWKVYSWKRKKNWFGASRCHGMKGTKRHFKSRAASSKHSTENCDTQFPSCRCREPASSSAISIIQMAGNYRNKYWWADVWEWPCWILTHYYTSACELHRNKWLEAQQAAEPALEAAWKAPVHAGKVRWWEKPLWPSQLRLIQCWEWIRTFWGLLTEKPESRQGSELQNWIRMPRVWGGWRGSRFAYSEEMGREDFVSRWPRVVLWGFNPSPGCWGRWRSVRDPENITKKLLANSSSLRKASRVERPGIKTLNHLKVLRC